MSDQIKFEDLVKRVSQLEKTIDNLVSIVENLQKLNTKLLSGSNRKGKEERKLSEEEVREIFRLHFEEGLSGYKISKLLDQNGPYIYNVLARKIYADVDISDLIK